VSKQSLTSGAPRGDATGQCFTCVRSSDFGYLVWCDGCCDDAEDFLLEVLGGESSNSLYRIGLRDAGVQHAGLRNDQYSSVHPAFGLELGRECWHGRDHVYEHAGPNVYLGKLQQREAEASEHSGERGRLPDRGHSG